MQRSLRQQIGTCFELEYTNPLQIWSQPITVRCCKKKHQFKRSSHRSSFPLARPPHPRMTDCASIVYGAYSSSRSCLNVRRILQQHPNRYAKLLAIEARMIQTNVRVLAAAAECELRVPSDPGPKASCSACFMMTRVVVHSLGAPEQAAGGIHVRVAKPALRSVLHQLLGSYCRGQGVHCCGRRCSFFGSCHISDRTP